MVSKILVTAQSIRMDDSAGLQYVAEFQRSLSNAREECRLASKARTSKLKVWSSSMSFLTQSSDRRHGTDKR